MNTLYKEISRCRVTFLKTTETTLKFSTISVISNLWWEKNDTSGEQLGGFYLYLWQPNHIQCFNQKDVFFPKTNQSISTVMSLHTQREIKPKEDWSCKIKKCQTSAYQWFAETGCLCSHMLFIVVYRGRSSLYRDEHQKAERLQRAQLHWYHTDTWKRKWDTKQMTRDLKYVHLYTCKR